MLVGQCQIERSRGDKKEQTRHPYQENAKNRKHSRTNNKNGSWSDEEFEDVSGRCSVVLIEEKETVLKQV